MIQVWIDGGARPNIKWQIAAFALLTAAEILVSIVALEFAATTILARAAANGDRFPTEAEGTAILQNFRDHWGRPLRYQIQNSTRIRIWSRGGDNQWNTEWDIGIIIQKPETQEPSKASWIDKLRPENPWLDRRKAALNQRDTADGGSPETHTQTVFSGGQVRLQGAQYFWFFSGIMGATALLFIPIAFFYRPKTYIQGA